MIDLVGYVGVEAPKAGFHLGGGGGGGAFAPPLKAGRPPLGMATIHIYYVKSFLSEAIQIGSLVIFSQHIILSFALRAGKSNTSLIATA